MSTLETLIAMGKRQLELEQNVVVAEDGLKKAKEELNKLKCIDIPTLMDELDITNFGLGNGMEVTIKRDIYPYVRNEDKPALHEWLKENNFGSIIKTSVIALFEKGDERAEAVYKQLYEEGLNVVKKDEIHAATFKKFIKECLEDGIQLPENVNIQPVNEAKIK